MSALDRVKDLRGRAVDRLCPQGIVFHHIPKCGGTSVGRALRRSYALSQATILPGPSHAAARTVGDGGPVDEIDLLHLREGMLAYLLHADTRAVAAHVPFSTKVHAAFGDRYAFVTVLRDPVERFLSHHRWSSARPGRHGHIALSLEDFVASRDAALLGSLAVRYLCGEPLHRDELADRGVPLAIENLARFDAVGTTDAMAAFEVRLREVTGKRISVGHENTGPRSTPLDPALRARIEELCAPDRAVWEAARATAR